MTLKIRDSVNLLKMSLCGKCKSKVDNEVHKIKCVCCSTIFHAKCVSLKPADIEFLQNGEAP